MRAHDTSGPGTGLRPLSSLGDGSDVLGDEGQGLGRLITAGEAVAPGWLVQFSEDGAPRLHSAVELALLEAEVARLRPLFPNRAAAARFERAVGTLQDITDAGQAAERIEQLTRALGAPDVTVALGGARTPVLIRVVACDARPAGWAASADPGRGDPDEMRVWSRDAPAAPWRVDRRTTRITVEGEGLQQDQVSRVADLADRAQLVLGRPVELEWCAREGRLMVVALRPLTLEPSFGQGAWRRVALMRPDEGTIAPLAIDALDKALGRHDERADEPRVRRIYARAYRRKDEVSNRLAPGADPASVARATARAARVTADVAAPLAAARRFQRTLGPRLEQIDAVQLQQLDREGLVTTLRDRHRLVVEAFVLIDRAREATLTTLMALEATVGALPRESFTALAAPRRLRGRRRVHEQLRRLAERIERDAGSLGPRSRLAPPLQRRWDELRATLVDSRPLGIDVRPDAYGASDAHMLEALREVPQMDDDAVERARREASRRLLATARSRPLGRSREAIAGSLLVLLGRVAQAKGRLAEGLASAMLRLRRGACEAGRRLCDMGVLDGPEDALYLHLAEIEEALEDEPGAYAARVRLRREDDARWARFEAPRRIQGSGAV